MYASRRILSLIFRGLDGLFDCSWIHDSTLEVGIGEGGPMLALPSLPRVLSLSAESSRNFSTDARFLVSCASSAGITKGSAVLGEA